MYDKKMLEFAKEVSNNYIGVTFIDVYIMLQELIDPDETNVRYAIKRDGVLQTVKGWLAKPIFNEERTIQPTDLINNYKSYLFFNLLKPRKRK